MIAGEGRVKSFLNMDYSLEASTTIFLLKVSRRFFFFFFFFFFQDRVYPIDYQKPTCRLYAYLNI